jgi:hypothetical protein
LIFLDLADDYGLGQCRPFERRAWLEGAAERIDARWRSAAERLVQLGAPRGCLMRKQLRHEVSQGRCVCCGRRRCVLAQPRGDLQSRGGSLRWLTRDEPRLELDQRRRGRGKGFV